MSAPWQACGGFVSVTERAFGAPLETKSGSFIYAGSAAEFHDWEFRTLLRVRLFEQQQKALAAKDDSHTPTGDEAEPEANGLPDGLGEEEDFPFPGSHASPKASPKRSPASSPKAHKSSKDITIDRSALVNKVVEGLRGDAFALARDLGLETLIEEGGVQKLVIAVKQHVFPRATEEAKELFRAGQRQQGPLSRQQSESMLSYCQSRRRWWKVLQELDSTMVLSETMRTELLLELSGISRQEILVVKACSKDQSFDEVVRVLIQNYSGIHLKESSRSWSGRAPMSSSGKFSSKGKGKSSYGSSSGKGYRSAYFSTYPDGEDEEWNEEYEYDDYQPQGLIADYGDDAVFEGPDYEDEVPDDMSDHELTVLNVLSEFEEIENEQHAGDAIQFQLAAFNSMSKAKGKGKFKGGKGKGKGKLVRSQLSIEQRRKRLAEIKAKSKCLRCGAIGHWAGDPSCKFPGPRKADGKGSKPTANFADMSDSSSDDGIVLRASASGSPVAHMAVRSSSSKAASKAAPKPKPKAVAKPKARAELVNASDVMLQPRGSDSKFPSGQFRGKTFWQVLRNHPDHFHWAVNNRNRSPVLLEYVEWVRRYFEIVGDQIYLLHEPSSEPLVPATSASSSASRQPPNPPLPVKCPGGCEEFSHRGSTAYTIRTTCLKCGYSQTCRREIQPQYDFASCPHLEIDHRGSSRSTHRTFCKQCMNFIDELPMELHRGRVQVARAVEQSGPDTVGAVSSMVDPDRTTFNAAQLDHLLGLFNSAVSRRAEAEELNERDLHEILQTNITQIRMLLREPDFGEGWMEAENRFLGITSGEDPDIDLAEYEDRTSDRVAHMGVLDEHPDSPLSASLCLYGEEDLVGQFVRVKGESRDMYDDPDVYCILDEGCNSTCHSAFWAEDACKKLNAMGYDFPLTSTEGKKFAGLGGGSKTEGLRSMPFAFSFVDNDKKLNGVLESHQLKEGTTPLLLSLHAQSALGLIKDMRTGKISIDNHEIPTYRCNRTGLVMVNLTDGLRRLKNDDGQLDTSHAIKVPKCHRRFRQVGYTAVSPPMPSFESDMEQLKSALGLRLSEASNVEETLRRALQVQGGNVIVLTAGMRFGYPQVPSDRRTLWVDCRTLHDPDARRELRGHVGSHPDILAQLAHHEEAAAILQKCLEHAQKYKNAIIVLYCSSGRHRSVGLSVLVHYGLVSTTGDAPFLIHCHSPRWSEMSCGGACPKCKMVGNWHNSAIQAMIPLIPELATVLTPRASSASAIAADPVGTAEVDVKEEEGDWNEGEEEEMKEEDKERDVGDEGNDEGEGGGNLLAMVTEMKKKLDSLVAGGMIRERSRSRPRSPPRSSGARSSRDIPMRPSLRQSSRSPLPRRATVRRPPVSPPRPPRKPETSSTTTGTPRSRPVTTSTSITRTFRATPSEPTGPPPSEVRRANLEARLKTVFEQGGQLNALEIHVKDFLSNELLSECVNVAKACGNRDRLLWICDETLEVDRQKTNGLRFEIKIRSFIHNTSCKLSKEMLATNPFKSTFIRERESSDASWQCVEDCVPCSRSFPLRRSWVDFVQVVQPGQRVYTAHHGVMRTPPNPPRPPRRRRPKPEPPRSCHGKPMNVCLKPKCEVSPKGSDMSMPGGEKSPDRPPGKFDVSTDSDSSSASSGDCSSSFATRQQSQGDPPAHIDLTALMAFSIPHSSSEIFVDSSDSDVIATIDQGTSEDPGTLRSFAIEPSERTTMSKRHRKNVLDGITNVNQHDQLLRSSIGKKHSIEPQSNVLVFTSHPLLFQDTHHTYDVGVNAQHLSDGVLGCDWQELFHGYRLIVVAIWYDHSHVDLNHRDLLHELELYCEANGSCFLHVDALQTPRWEHHVSPQVPFINELNLAYTTNWDSLQESFDDWFKYRTMDEVLSWDFCKWLEDWSSDQALEDMMSVAFPASLGDELAEGQSTFDQVMDPGDTAVSNPVESLVSEETIIDEVDVPGLPLDEVERRRQWRKLPQRVRIGIRRLRRQFGHVPQNTLIHLLRSAKVNKDFIAAAKLHRCPTCEQTAQRKPTHKTSLPSDFSFNHTLGIDLFEVRDSIGNKFQVLNMVDVGTSFQLTEVIKVGAGQASSKDCLTALEKRWVSWAGHPMNLVCDRGLHNRGILAQYMNEHNIQVYHAPLESPESIGRVERHGGLAKAMYRKVCSELGVTGKEQVESALNQVTMVKNDSIRHAGFSPSQWVLGKAPRAFPSLMSEEQHAELGAIEAVHDPSSIFALQHMARLEAKKAFVHIDCSKRVQRALTRNASAFPREFAVGDLVTFRRDNQLGGTRWSPTSRVIGHENGGKNLWLLCGNVPVLVSSHNVKIATPSEALAEAVLNGDPVIPSDVVGDGQQSFLDARQSTEEAVSTAEINEEYSPESLPPIPEGEDEEDVWTFRRGLFDDDVVQVDDEGDGVADEENVEVVSRRNPTRQSETPMHNRNVRARTEGPTRRLSDISEEPEVERGMSLAETPAQPSTPAQVGTPEGPRPWPSFHNSLDDLPAPLRRHFQEAREASSRLSDEDAAEAQAMLVCFLAQTTDLDEDGTPGKKVQKSIDYNRASPEVQAGLNEAMKKEWDKFELFSAAIPVVGEQKEALLKEGHGVIPSQWIHVDKNEHLKGRSSDEEYVPAYKSRLVSCGNFENSEGIRSDSPTADSELHNLLCAFAACHGIPLHSADVTSAYFQGRPLDRVLLMSQPRNGLPGVDPEALLLIRVPIYGLTDSGRGFFLKLDEDAKDSGLKSSIIYPALYYLLNDSDECVALMCIHVDDLLYAFLPEAENTFKAFLAKFLIGTSDADSFRYCGKQFGREDDGATITIDVDDNTRRIRKVRIDSQRRHSEPLTTSDLTALRSVVGSLAWIARQCRPDIAYRVSRLQSSIKGATVATLLEANRVVALASQGIGEVKLRFPEHTLQWNRIGLLVVTDASFSGEAGLRSQQGKMIFRADSKQLKDNERTAFSVLPLAFGSSTIRRVCRSTLQAETYSLQSGLEHADKLRGLLSELRGKIHDIRTWEAVSRDSIPMLAMSDCRSLTDHLAVEVPAKVVDKRLGIELLSIHQNLWHGNQKTWVSKPHGGDHVTWIATHSMIADCLTKSMKPDLLLLVLRTLVYSVVRPLSLSALRCVEKLRIGLTRYRF
eukprot:s119_g31.t1